MFDDFKYAEIPLSNIDLDERNPRLVTRKPLKTQSQIIEYLFAHEGLSDFLAKVSGEGRNLGAERPYVIKNGERYTVVEGNTRIAAYKLLTGLEKAPKAYQGKVSAITAAAKKLLEKIECSVAPSRDALLPIMANAHFGLGDKSKWGYLGSRKAVYDEWKAGRTVAGLAEAFARKKGQIRDYIIEYELYLFSLGFDWTEEEREKLEDPAVQFNPPVRFLQSQGHREKVGIELDRESLKISFADDEAQQRLKHVVKKLVVSPQKGLGATADFDAVFEDYKAKKTPGPAPSPSPAPSPTPPKLKPGALFNYPITIHSQLVDRLAKESRDLNCNNFPAAGTFLLRNFLEAILKHLIDKEKANPDGKNHDLEGALNLAMGQNVNLPTQYRNILAEFKKTHLSYINLGAHATIIPNSMRLFAARDCIDLFVKKYI
jgi:hypothetical protein